MERKFVELAGVSNEPNDYQKNDGELSVSLNAVKHNGSVRAVLDGEPQEDINDPNADGHIPGLIPDGYDVIGIHEIGNIKHYLAVYEDKNQHVTPFSKYVIDVFAEQITTPTESVATRISWESEDESLDKSSVYIKATEDGTTTSKIKALDKGEKVILAGKWNLVGVVKIYDLATVSTKDVDDYIVVLHRTDEPDPEDEEDEDDTENNEKGIYTLAYIDAKGETHSQTKTSTQRDSGETQYSTESGLAVVTHGTVEAPTYKLEAYDTEVDDKIYYIYRKLSKGHTLDITVTSNNAVYVCSTAPAAEVRCTRYEPADNKVSITASADMWVGINSQSVSFTWKESWEIEVTDTYGAYEVIPIAKFATPIVNVACTGNVLSVMRDDRPLYYFIWKDEEYQNLGDKLPRLEVLPYLETRTIGISDMYGTYGQEFTEDLVTETISGEKYNFPSLDEWKKLLNEKVDSLSFTSAQKLAIYNKLFAYINQSERCLNKNGQFMYPFLVRFALRLFDGSHVMMTTPQLMIPTTKAQVFCGVRILDTGYSYLQPIISSATLKAEISCNIGKWKDLINAVDVYVSEPIISFTDKQDAIAECVKRSTDTESSTDSVSDSDPWMMAGRKELASIYDSYSDTKNSYFVIGDPFTLTNGETIFQSNGYRMAYYGYDKTKSPNSIISNTRTGDSGYQDWFEYGDQLITTLDDGTKLYLSDSGLPNCANYSWYYWSWQSSKTALKVSSGEDIEFVVVYYKGKENGANNPFDYQINLRREDDKDFRDVLKNEYTFYKVAEIEVDDSRLIDGALNYKSAVPIEKNTLDVLTTHETLDANGEMRDKVTLKVKPLDYNNRLSEVVDKKTLPRSQRIADLCICNTPDTEKEYFVVYAYIRALENGQIVYRKLQVGTDSEKYTYAENLYYFYYPSAYATDLILGVYKESGDDYGYRIFRYKLTRHSQMNGAYAFNNFASLRPDQAVAYDSEEEMLADTTILGRAVEDYKKNGSVVAYGNLVRVSDVSNPFRFDEANEVNLPSGNIKGISTNTKALTQGQFGEFPLYCFSDNGIWALSVADTGVYGAKQPVSRAVCTNSETITQTEGEVLFVTRRGLMAISGSEVQCLSTTLGGHNYTSAISKLNEVLTLCGYEENLLTPIDDDCKHIEGWLQDARFLYDDVRRFIYAFRSDDVLGYVYSIDDQCWGQITNSMIHTVPSYTQALAVTQNKEDSKDPNKYLIDMSSYKTCSDDKKKSLIITRPISFGAEGYKTLEQIRARGLFDETKEASDDDTDPKYMKLVIWASNNLKDWYVIGSSENSEWRAMGTPYRFFRIGILLNWQEEDSLNGLECDVTERLNNRIR